MFWSPRFMVCLMTLAVLYLGLGRVPIAIAWTLRFVPLDHTTGTTAALTPSTSVPETPQFLRILVTGTQLILGVEAPYIRVIEFNPPIDFKQAPSSASPLAASAPTSHPSHHLCGPEAVLLRRPQAVVGNTFQ